MHSMPDVREQFIIRGGIPLAGSAPVFGSKNATSKCMIASLLTDEPCVIENVPLGAETEITRELCEGVGSSVVCGPDHSCALVTPRVITWRVPELSRRNRIPILALGPLLHRTGQAEVPFLGGDPIGHRPIDFHLDALAKMGITIERKERSYYARADAITGAEIELPFPSVGATENVLLTAALARGRTLIQNAAVEPEIQNLTAMLQTMGAAIRFDAPNRRIEIDGVSRLRGTTHRILPDRNEIVSFAAAAIATGGEIFIPDIKKETIAAFLHALDCIGAPYRETPQGMLFANGSLRAATAIETGPHPGFMTDWQQPFCVLLTQCCGESTIHETIYEDRFGYAKDLIRMGANIRVSDECMGASCRFHQQTFNHSARIAGPAPLYGADIEIRDIRAGMAHVIAALAANGESRISGIEHMDRGYERIDERLRSLGADIRRVKP